jgi:spermidine/putrescine transport system substrate-binding protein
MKKIIAIALMMALMLSLTACNGGDDSKKTSGKDSKELNIYMWQSYISGDLIKNFEQKNNCKVNLSYMSDNADSITKLTAGGGDEYDLVMTCDAYMKSLVDGKYIEKINMKNVPNTKNLNEAYWVDKNYCVPYLMNYIYVIYNDETCPIDITSYNDLINPVLKGKITSIDGARNLFPIALVALGYDPNTKVEKEIKEAYEWLKKFNDNVLSYGSTEQNIANGAASVAFTYDGNASWAMEQLGANNKLVIADFKKDKVQLGFDLYVVPKGAKHVDLAEKFLNYICEADVMAKNLEEFPYSCPNDAAIAAASDKYKNDPARKFSFKENVFFQEDVGDALKIYNDYYQQLKVGE